MKPFEEQYRRTGLPLTILLGLSLPVVFPISVGLAKLFHSSALALVFAGVWMALVVGFGTARTVAYWRWKHPDSETALRSGRN